MAGRWRAHRSVARGSFRRNQVFESALGVFIIMLRFGDARDEGEQGRVRRGWIEAEQKWRDLRSVLVGIKLEKARIQPLFG